MAQDHNTLLKSCGVYRRHMTMTLYWRADGVYSWHMTTTLYWRADGVYMNCIWYIYFITDWTEIEFSYI